MLSPLLVVCHAQAEQRARARLKVISGNVGEGLKLMRKARELAQRMSMPYDEALALSLLSRHTKSSMRESQALQQEASEILLRLGVDVELPTL